jgi:hypothetical protein
MGSSELLLDGHWDGSGDWGGLIFVPPSRKYRNLKFRPTHFHRNMVGVRITR